jgi:Co/Zn/Cd efflux system component
LNSQNDRARPALLIRRHFAPRCRCTAYVTYDGITTIQDIQKNGDDGDGVNEKIMFGFTVGNLFLDVGMILSIYLRHRGGIIGCLLRCVRTREQLEHHASCDGHGRPESGLVDSKEDINLFAASAHVAADTMRTVTVLATAIAIWADPSNDGEMADACAGLVVSAIIFCIASFVAWETWTQARAELALRRAEREGAPPPALTGAKAVV